MDHASLDTAPPDGLPHSPAAERNAAPILAVLQRVLAPATRVLEIASGTGQHAVHWAQALPGLQWQPSDCDPDALAAIRARVERAALPNLALPLTLDVCAARCPESGCDAIVCVNLLHIAPWAATEGLLAGAGRTLPSGAPLVIYGPFVDADTPTAPSNARFDAALRARDARWGLRDQDTVNACAAGHGLEFAEALDLPANNRLLLFHARALATP